MAAGDAEAICMSCKGYTNEQELQTCMSCYLKSPDEDFSSFQVYLDTKGKGVIPYTASYQTIDVENGIRVFMLRDLTKQYKTQEMLNQKMMTKNIIKAQEDERKRISRELHDRVAQEMLSSLVELRVLKYMNIDAEVLKKVQQTEGSLMRLLDDIRHLIRRIKTSDIDDLGTGSCISEHISNGLKKIMDLSSILQRN